MGNRAKLGLALIGLMASRSEATTSLTTPESLVINLAADDLAELGTGLDDIFAAQPITGRVDQRVEEPFWWGTLGIEGLSYSFRLSNVRITPADGRLRLAADVTELNVTIDKLAFDQSDYRYCEGVPVTSGDGTIPVATDIIMGVNDRDLSIVSANPEVALDSGNFAIGDAASCSAVWGLNWLVRRALPWTESMVRAKVATAVGDAAADALKHLATTLSTYVSASITLPFEAHPAPSFYATISLWPGAFEVTPEHFRFVMGADVTFDPDAVPPDEPEALPFTEKLAGLPLPSYLGIARGFLERLLSEANAKGLFRLTLDAQSLPSAADLLDAKTLARTLPDAATRFPPNAPVSLASAGARAIAVALDPDGPGGIPIIEANLQDLGLTLLVAGKPYYALNLDATLRFVLGYRKASRQLVLEFQGLSAAVADGHYVPGLTPAPTADLDPAGLAAFSKALSSRLASPAGSILSVGLPPITVGSRSLELLGSSVRDDFVTLDADVR